MDDVLQELSDQTAAVGEAAERWGQPGMVVAGAHGPVMIVMDFDGRVAGARLHSHWRQRLAGGDLGIAVMSTVREAQRLLLTDEVRLRPRAGKRPPDKPVPEALTHHDPAEFAAYLRTLLVNVQATLPKVASRTRNAMREEKIVKGANGSVVATSRGGTLVGLTCARSWLSRTGHAEISRVLTDVLARAVPGGTALMSKEMNAVGRVAEFRALMADPGRLLESLGLTNGGVR